MPAAPDRRRTPDAGGPPASFGRAAAEGPRAEDFTIRGGESFHLVLHVDVTPDAESLAALHTAVKEATRAAVLDGYAAAFAEMDSPAETPGEQPGGVHGGAPPGQPSDGGQHGG
jgi:hypothetical protein